MNFFMGLTVRLNYVKMFNIIRGVKRMHRYIGLDIGGTKCAVLTADVADDRIEIAAKDRFATDAQLGFAQAWERLVDATARAIDAAGSGVRAIGISCGGPLNSRLGVIQSPPNLPGWDNIQIVQMLQQRFGLPTFLQNDANACALVEWKLGAGRGCDNMIFLTMGTGMGAGIIAEGRLLRGRCDMAGEVGHLRLAKNGPVGFGKAGSFEGFCSGGGIARLAAMLRGDWAASGDVPAWTEADAELTTQRLAEYACEGDAHAVRVFDAAAEKLGEAIAILADTLNPERVVIGSVYARCEALLKDTMWRAIRREALKQTADALEVMPAQTGERIGDYAAIMVAHCGANGE